MISQGALYDLTQGHGAFSNLTRALSLTTSLQTAASVLALPTKPSGQSSKTGATEGYHVIKDRFAQTSNAKHRHVIKEVAAETLIGRKLLRA